MSADEIIAPVSAALLGPQQLMQSVCVCVCVCVCLPSLLQRTEAGPLQGFGVVAFNGVKQLPVGAPAHGVDLLIHGSVAADLKEKTSRSMWAEVLRGN